MRPDGSLLTPMTFMTYILIKLLSSNSDDIEIQKQQDKAKSKMLFSFVKLDPLLSVLKQTNFCI